MTLIFQIFLLCIISQVLCYNSKDSYTCEITYKYAKKCFFYNFAGDCQPYQIDKCIESSKVTLKESRCPRYSCTKVFI